MTKIDYKHDICEFRSYSRFRCMCSLDYDVCPHSFPTSIASCMQRARKAKRLDDPAITEYFRMIRDICRGKKPPREEVHRIHAAYNDALAHHKNT